MTLISDAAGVQQYLTFRMAGEEYAISILRVREIIQLDAITRVPSAPAWIRGVVNLRGGVVPVVDLAVKFGMEASGLTRWTCLVIVEAEYGGERMVTGLLADTVSQVMELAEDDIEPPLSFGTRIGGEYLLGMARQGNRFALLLDIDRILSMDDAHHAREAVEAEAAAALSAEAGAEAAGP
ncbi:MAG TPA: chemotaxis protein CheW [Longimicrobium sp.]|jgi:purine-binding chemotaxis protein CheW|uniref:chemotaxis protein CheW n=1 Tax=Longimicrobium sp. TaxID=2029185 RepID=UPI002ED7842C